MTKIDEILDAASAKLRASHPRAAHIWTRNNGEKIDRDAAVKIVSKGGEVRLAAYHGAVRKTWVNASIFDFIRETRAVVGQQGPSTTDGAIAAQNAVAAANATLEANLARAAGPVNSAYRTMLRLTLCSIFIRRSGNWATVRNKMTLTNAECPQALPPCTDYAVMLEWEDHARLSCLPLLAREHVLQDATFCRTAAVDIPCKNTLTST